MIQQEKELLLKDLCSRLPYGVRCAIKPHDPDIELPFSGNHHIQTIYNRDDDILFVFDNHYHALCIENIKPYLRPMSSKTKEEKEYVEELSEFHCTPDAARDKIDFYLEHFIDYRGLIKKGLAIEAPEGMYKED